MYKKQMTAQKILCLAAVITSAIFFLYALGIMTDLYDSLYDTMRNPSNPFQTDVSGSIVYYNMQEFNRMFLMYSIGQILLGGAAVCHQHPQPPPVLYRQLRGHRPVCGGGGV